MWYLSVVEGFISKCRKPARNLSTNFRKRN